MPNTLVNQLPGIEIKEPELMVLVPRDHHIVPRVGYNSWRSETLNRKWGVVVMGRILIGLRRWGSVVFIIAENLNILPSFPIKHHQLRRIHVPRHKVIRISFDPLNRSWGINNLRGLRTVRERSLRCAGELLVIVPGYFEEFYCVVCA